MHLIADVRYLKPPCAHPPHSALSPDVPVPPRCAACQPSRHSLVCLHRPWISLIGWHTRGHSRCSAPMAAYWPALMAFDLSCEPPTR